MKRFSTNVLRSTILGAAVFFSGLLMAQAQSVSERRSPAPDIPSIVDQHGVNLRSGMVSRDILIAQIGSGETADQSVVASVYLQWGIEAENLRWVSALNQEQAVQANVYWAEYVGGGEGMGANGQSEIPVVSNDFSVNTISGTHSFRRSYPNYIRKRSSIATLSEVNGPLNEYDNIVPDYEFVADDGSILKFGGGGSVGDGPEGIHAVLSEKIKPDGEVLTYSYGGNSWLDEGLSTVSSNLGYQFRRYDNNAIINLSELYCDSGTADCSALPNNTSPYLADGGAFTTSDWPNGDGFVNASAGAVTNNAGDKTSFNATYTTELQQYSINGNLEYRSIMNTATIIDPEGIAKTYNYTYKNNIQVNSYDNKVARIDVLYAGQTWTYQFEHGNGADSWSTAKVTTPTGEVSYYAFDKYSNLKEHVSGYAACSPANNSSQTTQDAEFPNTCTPQFSLNPPLKTVFEYYPYHYSSGVDGYGRVKSVTYPEGNSVHYTYDASGRMTEVRKKGKVFQPSWPGQVGPPVLPDMVETYTYASCTNQNRKHCAKPLIFTNERGLTTIYTYADAHGGLTSVTSPNVAGIGLHKTNVEYGQFHAWYKTSENGNLVKDARPVWRITKSIECVVANSTTDCADGSPDVRVTEYGYQQGNASTPSNVRLISTTVRAGDASVSTSSTLDYDVYGRIAWSDGPLPGASDRQWFEYDQRNNIVLTTQADPDGAGPQQYTYSKAVFNKNNQAESAESGWVNAYQGSRTFVPLGSSLTQFDNYGRPDKAIKYDENGNISAITQTSYDASGRIDCTALRMDRPFTNLPSSACSQSSAGIDRISRVEHDAYGRAYKASKAVGTPIEQSEYAAFTDSGLTLSRTDANGNVTTYEYDAHNRLSRTYYPNKAGTGSSATDYDEWTYKVENGLATSLEATRRYRDGQIVSYAYDALSRIVLVDAPGTEDDVSSTYDVFGNLSTQTKDGKVLTYQWNALGQLASEQTSLGILSYMYDDAGRRTRTTYPDNFYVSYEYAGAGGIETIKENGAKTLADYQYDVRGRQTKSTLGNGIEVDFGFDPSARLQDLDITLPMDVVFNQEVDFDYNVASQLTSIVHSNDSYLPTLTASNRSYGVNGLNQLTSENATSYTYDDRGNLTTDGNETYGYDIFNQLTSVAGNTLNYDAAGRLSKITSPNGTVTQFLYDGAALIAEYDGAGALVRRYIDGPGIDDTIVWYEGAAVSDATRRYLVPDERGSIILIADNQGVVVHQNRYDPFGEPDPNNLGRFQYTGQVWLVGTGLYHYKARAYSPRIGRFLQTDPIGYGDGLNWYNYAGSDPINVKDPTGNWGINLIVGVVSFVGGAVVDAAYQGVQIYNGDRDSFDGWQTLRSATVSGGTGFAAATCGTCAIAAAGVLSGGFETGVSLVEGDPLDVAAAKGVTAALIGGVTAGKGAGIGNKETAGLAVKALLGDVPLSTPFAAQSAIQSGVSQAITGTLNDAVDSPIEQVSEGVKGGISSVVEIVSMIPECAGYSTTSSKSERC